MAARPDAKNTAALTQSQTVRIELIQLAYRHDRSPDDIIERARKLEGYVSETSARKRVEDREGDDDAPI